MMTSEEETFIGHLDVERPNKWPGEEPLCTPTVGLTIPLLEPLKISTQYISFFVCYFDP